MKPEEISLFYAKSRFLNEWVLLIAKCSFDCQAVLRTAGMGDLNDHPLPKDGFDDKWRWAEFHGTWQGKDSFTGRWKGW